MIQISKLKPLICSYIIIREWIENGEFARAERIIVIGTRFQAAMVKMLFKGTGKRIFYIEKLGGKYAHDSNTGRAGRTKWIVFGNRLKRKLPKNDCKILFMPRI